MSEKEFETIFKTYYQDIYNFIYHYVMSKEEAKNLTQDVFLAYLENQKTLPENTKSYLLSLAKNRCISYFRHRNVMDRNALKYFESLLFSATNEYDATYDELLSQLQRNIDKLSPLQQKIIQMKLTDKNYVEMSEELGVTLSQIHKNIKKAYNKIRQNSCIK